MNPRAVARHTSTLLYLVGALMVPPMILAATDGEGRSVFAYGVSALVSAAAGVGLRWLGRGTGSDLQRRDAIGVVSSIWVCIGLLGALPFLIEGSITDPFGAIFEAVSGFTTTGATVVGDVDALTRATNLWRCEMHWVGGMGIVVLFIAIFPQLGVGAKHLFKTEVPGPITEGLRPRIKQTALVLWWIYAALTVLATVLLMVAGMSLYDAVCHAFSTLGTGGFSTRTASVGGFRNPAVDWIICAFMFLAGLNFSLYFAAVRGNLLGIFRNYEVRFFALVNLVVIAVISWGTLDRHQSALDTVRHATFQTLAVTTTTGFMTEDFDAYPNVARFMLFVCMFMGACAGSTAGGLKASRVYTLFSLCAREVKAVIQPQAVVAVRLGGTALSQPIIQGILLYLVAYLIIFVAASLILIALGLDLISGTSAVVACLSSVGPGFGQVGPTQSYAFIPAAGKLVLSFCMIAGRLEIFALLAVFHVDTWRR